ncbi:glycerophosphodiester phosphodiesterase family protein [Peijinzhouia sedimentorum]
MKKIFFSMLILFAMNASAQQYDFDLQGHRGARGLAPENSIPAFLKALEYEVTTLELDVVITKDMQVVVSHEPWLNADICLDANGNRIPAEKQKEYNIFEMTLEELQKCDCGSIGHPGFPEQVSEPVVKPLLSQVFEIAERYVAENGLAPIYYNIEIKSTVEDEEGGLQPDIETFAHLVFEEFEKSGIEPSRIIMQSFDFRVLQLWNEKTDKYPLAALVANAKTWQDNIADLGFTPTVYSPYYKLLTAATIKEIQTAGMVVIPWTVNTTEEMRELLEWGVDGIITDSPDRAVGLRR